MERAPGARTRGDTVFVTDTSANGPASPCPATTPSGGVVEGALGFSGSGSGEKRFTNVQSALGSASPSVTIVRPCALPTGTPSQSTDSSVQLPPARAPGPISTIS